MSATRLQGAINIKRLAGDEHAVVSWPPPTSGRAPRWITAGRPYRGQESARAEEDHSPGYVRQDQGPDNREANQRQVGQDLHGSWFTAPRYASSGCDDLKAIPKVTEARWRKKTIEC